MNLQSVHYKHRNGYPNDPVIQIIGKFDIGTIVLLSLQKQGLFYYPVSDNKKLKLSFYTIKEAKEYAENNYVELIDKHFSKLLKQNIPDSIPEPLRQIMSE